MSLSLDTVDMDACAREPIHIPGSVQPYGALLVIEPASGQVLQASGTAADLLGVPHAQLIGQRWDALLTLEARTLPAADAVREPLHLAHEAVGFPQRADAPSEVYVAAWHLAPSQWLVEIEPRDSQASDVGVRDVLPVLRLVERDRHIHEASLRVAREIHAQLGYDRVMVYRFDNDWNGDIIAEARRPELEAYLGLHYPATDIPAQARALYLRNRVRQIAHVGYRPSPIEPPLDPRDHAPVDLSDVSIRSVSPVHLEYLGNMGVSATLVTSIVVNDVLWGLIACHHYAPLFASHAMRDVADALTRGLAARIGALQAVERARTEAVLLTVREKLITAFNNADTLSTEMLTELAPELMDVVDADGVAIYNGDEVIGYGTLPSVEDLVRIRQQIEARDDEVLREGVVGALHVDAIGSAFPELADLAPLAAGLIFVPLMPQARSALLWTRREQIETINWAGNPELAKLVDIPNSRLSPRKSFDLWQQTVRGQARPWSLLHLESARSLRVLIELMERKRVQQDFSLLEASLARLRQGVAIIERGPTGIGRVLFANDAFAHLADEDASGMIGRDMRALLDPSVSEAQLQALKQGLHAREPSNAVLPLRVANADPVLQQFDFEPLPASRGQVSHWLLQLRDPD
ncbi:bacteriophytochrome BphP [Pseudoxanthomonas winnipegensis]|uniref:GAF domain-containing protein n=1 Tax=Pseudoxanthomonas winnipegensis TaxID=2480810 RepID=A0A4Q8LPI4_9GAMM|nr:bacteriophytochrome BphP [Pseudoxanthomonas winnipegensis]RZZ89844.1 GAF domain-containing protein [Pseudoxanthomonas winnipegensis]TAA32731.1 GAF domain-containing protein [Pseudoxanthomonas winnipegensis]TBV72475.1 GAF domain-containing protein [Pseudoxanthomonas winnipegensis]